MCLVNDAVYIAKLKDGSWEATGKQFAEPYVYKTLFSKEPLEPKDYAQVKQVQTALYLDFNEDLGEDLHDYKFIGKTGSFIPVVEGSNGGLLLRHVEGDKYTSAVGAKGYRWMEAEVIKDSELKNIIDISFYNKLANDAKDEISKHGDFEWFVS